jgi:hypothetical protein
VITLILMTALAFWTLGGFCVAMARNMPKPGPVLRPVPQGAPS